MFGVFSLAIDCFEDFEYLEFFAGKGNLHRCMRAAKCKSCRFDITDSSRKPHRKSNFMDLMHSSECLSWTHTVHGGRLFVDCFLAALPATFASTRVVQLRLAILYILRAKPSALCHFELKCSSFVGMSKGTSRRRANSSIGYLGHPSVKYSNFFLERTDVPSQRNNTE